MQVGSMLLSPLPDQTVCTLWELSLKHLTRLNGKNGIGIPINGVEMRNAMLAKIHPNRDSIKPCDNRHVDQHARRHFDCHLPNDQSEAPLTGSEAAKLWSLSKSYS